jgi:hypothetical protein
MSSETLESETPFLVLFGIAPPYQTYHRRRVLCYVLTNVSLQCNTENIYFASYTCEKTVILISQEVLSTVWKPAYVDRNVNAM